MPVYKYKTFEKARKALWNFYPDQAYFKQLADLWDTADKLCPISYARGVFKFRSINEANKQRKESEIDHAKKLRLNRNSEPQNDIFLSS
jgi:hypothetical protein